MLTKETVAVLYNLVCSVTLKVSSDTFINDAAAIDKAKQELIAALRVETPPVKASAKRAQ